MSDKTSSKTSTKATGMDKEQYMERLIGLIEADHRVIEQNTTALSKLISVIEKNEDVLNQMHQTLMLLIQQITVSISQRTDSVPMKSHERTVAILVLIVFVMVAILALVFGLNLGDMVKTAAAQQ